METLRRTRAACEWLHPGDAALDACVAALMVAVPTAAVGVLIGRLHWSAIPASVGLAVALGLAACLAWATLSAIWCAVIGAVRRRQY